MKTKALILNAAIVLTAAAAPAAAQEAPSQLTLRSGVSGGSWFPIGASIMDILGSEGVRANAEPGGAASNIVAVANGQVPLGFTMSVLPELARQGAAPFDSEVSGMEGISVVFPNFGHVMVREGSDVTSFPDLEGKNFATQPVGTGTELVFADMLKAYDLSEEDLELTRGGQSHGADQVRDRRAVGLTATTAAPSGTLTELAASLEMKFLGIDDEHFAKMKELNPGYTRATLPAGTYPGQENDVAGVGTDTILVVSEDMPEEQVYWITKTLVENIDQLKQTHSAMSGLTPEGMAQVQGVDLHPGARRYYEEEGLL